MPCKKFLTATQATRLLACYILGSPVPLFLQGAMLPRSLCLKHFPFNSTWLLILLLRLFGEMLAPRGLPWPLHLKLEALKGSSDETL